MRISKQLTIFAGFALLALAATPVMAQPGGGGRGGGPGRGMFGDPEQFFQMMDENGDGNVTMTEFSGLRERMAQQFGQGGQGGQGGQNAQGQRGQGGQRGGFGLMERLQEQLGASAEEWTVLEPLIQAVVDAQRDLNVRGGGRGGQGGFGGGQGGPNANAELTALRDAVDNDAKDIADKLKAYREARKAKEETLAKAREELKAVVTPKQEAILVMSNNILE